MPPHYKLYIHPPSFEHLMQHNTVCIICSLQVYVAAAPLLKMFLSQYSIDDDYTPDMYTLQ